MRHREEHTHNSGSSQALKKKRTSSAVFLFSGKEEAKKETKNFKRRNLCFCVAVEIGRASSDRAQEWKDMEGEREKKIRKFILRVLKISCRRDLEGQRTFFNTLARTTQRLWVSIIIWIIFTQPQRSKERECVTIFNAKKKTGSEIIQIKSWDWPSCVAMEFLNILDISNHRASLRLSRLISKSFIFIFISDSRTFLRNFKSPRIFLVFVNHYCAISRAFQSER